MCNMSWTEWDGLDALILDKSEKKLESPGKYNEALILIPFIYLTVYFVSVRFWVDPLAVWLQL